MDNRTNFLLNRLVQEKREQDRQAQEMQREAEAPKESQTVINDMNAECAAREMLSGLRAMPGRDY